MIRHLQQGEVVQPVAKALPHALKDARISLGLNKFRNPGLVPWMEPDPGRGDPFESNGGFHPRMVQGPGLGVNLGAAAFAASPLEKPAGPALERENRPELRGDAPGAALVALPQGPQLPHLENARD